MSVITINTNPTTNELRAFAVLWLIFFLVLAMIALGEASGLLWAAGITGVCLLISFALNKDFPLREQMLGLAIPGALLAIWLLRYLAYQIAPFEGTARVMILTVLAIIAIAGAAGIFASKTFGTSLYRNWILAALPIGWTISHILLGIVFYGVITPIGLIMRALGRDSMERAFDPAATTYWVRREEVTDPARYFRQF